MTSSSSLDAGDKKLVPLLVAKAPGSAPTHKHNLKSLVLVVGSALCASLGKNCCSLLSVESPGEVLPNGEAPAEPTKGVRAGAQECEERLGIRVLSPPGQEGKVRGDPTTATSYPWSWGASVGSAGPRSRPPGFGAACREAGHGTGG